MARSVKAQLTTLAAALFFALMAFGVKLLSFELPAAEILFIRAVFSILLIGSVLTFLYRGRVRVHNFNLLVVRGVFGGLSVLCYFIAIERIPLSAAVLLANSYPIFAVFFSAVLLKERPNLDSLAALLIAMAGMLLVVEPRFGRVDLGYLLAIGAALFGGVAVTSIRELRKTDSSWLIALYQMLGAIVFSLVLLPGNFRVPSAPQWGWLLLVGLFGTAAQLLFSRPFRFLPTAEGSMVAPLYSAIAMVLSVLFLNEVLTVKLVGGAALIFSGLVYLIAREEFLLRRHAL